MSCLQRRRKRGAGAETIYENGASEGSCCPENALDMVLLVCPSDTDRDGVDLAMETMIADVDIVIGVRILSGVCEIAKGDIAAAGVVVRERLIPLAVLKLPVVLLKSA